MKERSYSVRGGGGEERLSRGIGVEIAIGGWGGGCPCYNPEGYEGCFDSTGVSAEGNVYRRKDMKTRGRNSS